MRAASSLPRGAGPVRSSTFAGAARVLLQIAAALLVYPSVVVRGGPTALGIWITLLTIVGYGGLRHLGYGTFLAREIASQGFPQTRTHFRVGLGLGLILLGVLGAFVGFGGVWAPHLESGTVGLRPLVIWLVFAATGLRLASAVYGSVLTGLQQHSVVLAAEAAQSAVFLLVYFLVPHPDLLLSLARAYLWGSAVEVAAVLVAVRRSDRDVLTSRPLFSYASVQHAARLSGPYVAMDVSLVGREPLLKLVMLQAGGAAAVGIYELATKVPSAIRQAFLAGLTALMPAMAAVGTQTKDARALAAAVLRYSLWGAAGSLVVYLVHAQALLVLWLGTAEADLVRMTQLMALWWGVTALNVPAWWGNIAAGGASENTSAVAFHLLCTIALAPASYFLSLSPFDLALAWVATGVLMQFILYRLVQRRSGIVRSVYCTRESVTHYIVFLFACLGVWTTSSITLPQSFGALMPMASAAVLAVFAVVAHILVRAQRHMQRGRG